MKIGLIAVASLVLTGVPAAAQVRPTPAASATPKPTRVVARSGRLVTARTSNGGTMSYNCKRPANRHRSVCRK